MPTAASISDFRELARRRLPPLLFHYLDGGSYDEITLRRNVSELQAIALRQRVMRDVSRISLETEWFGQKVTMPVGLGPVGFAGMFARRGEIQAARAAEKAGVPFCLSTLGICDVVETASASSAPIWFQFYMIKDRGVMASLLERVAAQRCSTLVFTADLPVAGARYRDYRSGMSGPPGLAAGLGRVWQGLTHPAWLWDVHVRGRPHCFGNLVEAVKDAKGFGQFAAWVAANFDPTLTWKDLAWVRSHWNGPIVLKGVLDAEDARAALDAGVDGIVVSNHGGRQLDGALASVAALPRVVEAARDLRHERDRGLRAVRPGRARDNGEVRRERHDGEGAGLQQPLQVAGALAREHVAAVRAHVGHADVRRRVGDVPDEDFREGVAFTIPAHPRSTPTSRSWSVWLVRPFVHP